MSVETAATHATSPGPLQSGGNPVPPPGPRRTAPVWLRTILSIILAVGSLVFAGRVFSGLASLKVEPPREEPVPAVFRVEAFVVERTPLQKFISGFGTAQSERVVTVSAEVAGRITESSRMKVGRRVEGSRVTFDGDGKSQQILGDVIVQIDPQTYRERFNQIENLLAQDAIELQQLEVQHETNLRLLEQQESRLATLKQETDRYKRLLASGAGRETDVQRAELDYQQYLEGVIKTENEVSLYPSRKLQWQSRKTSHESDLALARLELEKATIRAPFSGVLSEVNVEEGQYVRPGDRLVTITNLERVEVAVPVPLSDAAILGQMLAEGKFPRAELSTDEDALVREVKNRIWFGEVRRLAPVANQQTRTTMAYVEVNNSEQTAELRPGTFVQARIEAHQIPADAGVVIPRDALVNGTVYVVADGGEKARKASAEAHLKMAQLREVEVLETLQTFVLVKGLSDHDQVVMTNLDIISEGCLLDVRKENLIHDEFVRLRVPYLKQLPAESAGNL